MQLEARSIPREERKILVWRPLCLLWVGQIQNFTSWSPSIRIRFLRSIKIFQRSLLRGRPLPYPGIPPTTWPSSSSLEMYHPMVFCFPYSPRRAMPWRRLFNNVLFDSPPRQPPLASFWKMDGWEGSVPIRVWTRSLLRTATSSLCSLLHLNLSLRPASLPSWIYAYHLVHIRQGDEWEMAFITPNGLMEYLLIPFNWCNSPAIFQHLIKHIFWDLLSFCVFAYLDDFLIWSRLYLVCDCGA